jgi:(R,R)-butanediol dehydrogenase / meso-butanediol dehydrogenase / diacetyl reductase
VRKPKSKEFGVRSVVFHSPQNISCDEKPVSDIPENWSRVKVAYAGICGTDLNIFVGSHPRAKGPLILGHEIAGVLEDGHSTFEEGTHVVVQPLLSCGICEPCKSGNEHVCRDLRIIGIDCDGGMAEYVSVPNNSVYALPKDLPLQIGALVEPLAVGIHAVSESGIQPGDTALIFGAGTIGLCTAIALKYRGVNKVTIVETVPFRLMKAKEMGFRTIDPKVQDLAESMITETGVSGSDYTFDCAGHPSVAEQLVKVTKIRGKIMIVGAYKKPPAIDLLEVMFKEITLQGARVYTKEDFKKAIEWLPDVSPFLKRIITHVLSPNEAQKGFELLLSSPEAVKILLSIHSETE